MRQYASLKEKARKGSEVKPFDLSDITFQKLVDLTDVVPKMKRELPHTKARMKKATYRSMLLMKKRNTEIAD